MLAVHRLEELRHKLHALTRQEKWGEMAAEVPDDVARLFATVGRDHQTAHAITERCRGLTDALNARANPELPGHLPRGLVQDIRRIPHRYRGLPQ